MSLCRPGGSFREGIAVGLAVRLGSPGEKGRGRSGNLVAIPGGLIYREEEASINSRKGDVGERQKHDKEERERPSAETAQLPPQKGSPASGNVGRGGAESSMWAVVRGLGGGTSAERNPRAE
jgi:hypothetical protein